MIKIKIKNDGRLYDILVEGHAGGEYGKDIVCSAISTLFHTFTESVKYKPYVSCYTEDITSGRARVTFEYGSITEIRTIIEVIEHGLRMVANDFPERVTIDAKVY